MPSLRALALPYAARRIAARCPPRAQRCTGRGSTPVPRRSRRRSARWRMPAPTSPARPPRRRPASVTVFVDGLRLDVAHRSRGSPRRRRLRRCVNDEPRRTADGHRRPPSRRSSRHRPIRSDQGRICIRPTSPLARRHRSRCCASLMAENGVQVLGPDRDRRSRPDCVDRSRRDRPPRPRRRRPAGRLPRRGGRPDRRPDPRAARRRLAAGRRRHRPRLDAAAGRHGEGRASGGDDRGQEGPMRPAQGRRRGRRRRPCRGSGIHDVRIALAPGVTCFEANKEYEHGGVSPQECIVPRLTVTAGHSAAGDGGPEITKVKWLGLLCRVEFSGVTEKVVVDLRGLPADPKTSIAEEAKETSSAGKVSLFVPDEEHEGERAHLVLVALDGADPRPARGHRGEEPVTELDELDRLAADVFEGYLVRKDLAQQFRGQYPVPDLRRRVPARPVLRHDRPRRDRRGPRGRRAVDEGAHRPRRRGGAVQVARAGEGQGQDHRPAARAARRQVPTPTRPSCRASSSTTSTSPTSS